MTFLSAGWQALVLTLPTANATARMRIWRALKALGCATLRDGVYLLPDGTTHLEKFLALAEEVQAAGGEAHVLLLHSRDAAQTALLRGLFDRSAEYAAWQEKITGRELPAEPAALRRLLRQLRREWEALREIDFFPGAAQAQAEAALQHLEAQVAQQLAPGEPQAAAGLVTRLERAAYQNRRWATRRRPWVDRLASAWLIRRFIDSQAQFLWLDTPADCPPDTLGFDFDGAAFTHVGAWVTFEVLLHRFDLTGDAALQRLAGVVHYLDAGGIPAPEAAGLETLLRGAQAQYAEDDRLLAEAEKVFNWFYAGIS